ncbi:UDP-N-acetylmuramate--L-alanine ligase [Pilibacter termitis]|uniref:UDP-N-acetylmuramate--L-alanine ligase n=1 Tax=Pilibacter termitis TaxID=263852 RepID=A0A1T4K408_9ENTE|nr:UDP-N-acetylmuramate--L-alanine ligase [Pilibacter termitis]SJZ37067.1 UDP-N-acetylmuramate--L-alanine ligase [Pilibacter termitis]
MNKETTYFFIGIKGSGMSALALVLNEMGYKVAGSDVDKHFFTQRGLENAGVEIYSFDENNIQAGFEIILGNAFKEDHPEVVRAKELGLNIQRYHEFLGKFIEGYTSIGVAGAHGKTSTTGLISHIFKGIVPTSYLIGDGTGHGEPNAKFFTFESDEYERHFLPYHPDYSIITNVDFDHPDYYTSIDDVFSAFQSYAKNVKKGIFAYGADKYLRKLEADVPIYYYGTEENDDFQAVNIDRTTSGSTFEVKHEGEIIGKFHVPTFGEHNVMNALAVLSVAFKTGLDMRKVEQEIQTFPGVKRRFSEKIIGETVVIDDFAHHPAEIKATLDAARQKYPDRKVAAVFQPHTFTRTIALMDEFAESLELADAIYLGEIYGSARETSGDVNIEDLAAKLTKGGTIISEENMSSVLEYEGEVVVFMGAGDIQKFEFAFEYLLSRSLPNKQ